MRRWPAALVLLLLARGAAALPGMPLDYRIDVRVDPDARSLTGAETVRLRHAGPADLERVFLHLYLQGFAGPDTTWMREADPADVLASFPDAWGSCTIRAVRQQLAAGAQELRFHAVQPDDGNPHDGSLVEVALASAVASGEELLLEVEFDARLPVPFARTGVAPGFVMLAQFFPKLAAPSARAHQFHADTEFFAPFADHEVHLALPPQLQVVGPVPGEIEAPGRWVFRSRAVHDVAFAAAPALLTETFAVEQPGGEPLQITLAAPPEASASMPRVRAATVFAVRWLAERLQPLPWPTLTVVIPPWSARRVAGMEYPQLAVAATGDPLWELPLVRDVRYPEAVVVHEVAHQWFQGLVATHEVEAAYLDEGLASYAELRILEAFVGPASLGAILGREVSDEARRRLALLRTPLSEPIAGRPSFLYEPGTKSAQVYARSALTLRTAERLFGEAAVDRLLRDFVRAGAFGHPDLEDLLGAATLQPGGLLAFLHEAFERPDVPGFRVSRATSVRASGEGAWDVTVSTGGESASVRRSLHVVREGAAVRPCDVDVIVEGPSWRNLPVSVELVFEGGTVLRDAWDGTAPWRRYRLRAPAPLAMARVDADGLVALDPDPADNALAPRPHEGFAADLAAWCAQLVAWMVG